MRTEEKRGQRSKDKPLALDKGALLYRGQALYVRSARQTARTIEAWVVLRHFVPNQGLHPLRLRLSLRTCQLETVLSNQ